jgi:hypothetical protein
MRRFLTILLGSTASVLLAIAVVAACGDDSDPRSSESSDTTAPDTTAQARPSRVRATTSAPPSTTASTSPEPAAEDTTIPPDDAYAGCSELGTDAVALQHAVEEGHQPWRGSPESVAEAGAACAIDTAPGTLEAVGENRYRASDTATGEQVIVEVAQPLGPGTVWLIASVTAT